MELSDVGKIIDSEIGVMSNTYDSVTVDKYVVMPNHIHLVLLVVSSGGRTQFAPTVSRVIKQFKGSVTKQIGSSVWQKSFYEHIVRNEAEYLQIWRYIDENPQAWQYDRYYSHSCQ